MPAASIECCRAMSTGSEDRPGEDLNWGSDYLVESCRWPEVVRPRGSCSPHGQPGSRRPAGSAQPI